MQTETAIMYRYYVHTKMHDITTSYTNARQNLASLLDKVEADNAIALITRKGHKDIALLPAEELSSILETLHLLRSPANAQRLFEAIAISEARDDLPASEIPNESLEELIFESQNNL